MSKSIHTPEYWHDFHARLVAGVRAGDSMTELLKREGMRANVAAYNFRKLGLNTRITEMAGTSQRGVNQWNKPEAKFVHFVPAGMEGKPKIDVVINGKTHIYCDNDDVQGLKTIMSCCTLEAA